MVELPIAPVKRMLKNAGASRVSDEAAVQLTKILEELGEDVGAKANKLARHAGRKTVTADDIKLAVL